MLKDRYGLDMSTSSQLARDHYVVGVDKLLCALPGADTAFDDAIKEDPRFALAHAAKARVLQLNNRLDEARTVVARAGELSSAATSRERQHVQIFAHLTQGQGTQARQLTETHIACYPRDALALSPSVGVFGLYGFSGLANRESALMNLLTSVATEYGEDWWFLSAHAFAMIENGRAHEGIELVERSLALLPRNANSAHIFAHGLYETANDTRAEQFLTAWLPEYSPQGQMHCHLWWHLALMHLFMGNEKAMWRTYETYCAPGASSSPPINVVTDGVSLLWRARLAGFDCDRVLWTRLRDYIESEFATPGIFIDVHYGFCLAAIADEVAMRGYLDQLRFAETEGRLIAGCVVPKIVEAAWASAMGDSRDVIKLLAPKLDAVVRIGGSRAQRDLVSNTLIAAYLDVGDRASAQAVLARRGERERGMPIVGLRSE